MKAVVVVDVQNDFVSGSLGSPWAQSVTKDIAKYLESIKDNPEYVIFATRDTHSEDYLETLEGKNLPVVHCVKNTEGWQLAPEIINLIKDDNIDNKTSFMSCYRADGTCEDIVDIIENERWLRRVTKHSEQLDEIIICGFVTSICVVSNALRLRGAYPNTKITVYSDLCADINTESHQAALTVMKNCQINIETFNK